MRRECLRSSDRRYHSRLDDPVERSRGAALSLPVRLPTPRSREILTACTTRCADFSGNASAFPWARTFLLTPPIMPRTSAHRYANRLDWFAAIRMEDLGIPNDRIGSNDHDHGLIRAAFNPYERHGGGISPGQRMNLDSGIFNDDLMKAFGRKADMAWKRARVRTRADVCLAHEFEEGNCGTHDGAIECAPDTVLPISDEARELARVIREGSRRR